MLIEQGSKLIMIGDSITDADRNRPVGEGLHDGTGKTYVGMVHSLLGATYPERKIRVVNMGVSGNTVRDLKARWQTDVIQQKPDWLSILIGINDVWRQFDSPLISESHVYIDEYEQTLNELVTVTKPCLKGLVLMSPYYIEPNRNDAMRATMDQYGEVVRKIAHENNAIFVDLQAEFDKILRHCHPNAIAWDRVHPNLVGHMLIARAFLNAVGYEWNGRV